MPEAHRRKSMAQERTHSEKNPLKNSYVRVLFQFYICGKKLQYKDKTNLKLNWINARPYTNVYFGITFFNVTAFEKPHDPIMLSTIVELQSTLHGQRCVHFYLDRMFDFIVIEQQGRIVHNVARRVLLGMRNP